MILFYEGLNGEESKCEVTFSRKTGEENIVVIFTELPDNPGALISKVIDKLATRVYKEFLSDYPVEKIKWFEHYPSKQLDKEIFEEVTFLFDGYKFYSPSYQSVPSVIMRKYMYSKIDDEKMISNFFEKK